MTRIAFSTVACPDWTLDRVARAAVDSGFHGVEFRSLGRGGAEFANDPGLTSPEKVRRTLRDAGVEAAGVATGVRYDAPVFPPVLGHLFPTKYESIVRTKDCIEIALGIGAPFVRVFGFGSRERRGDKAMRRRVVERLRLAADAARHTGVRVVLENGGAFPLAEDVASLIDEVDSPLLGACYSISAAVEAGEDPVKGVATLGWRLLSGRIKDLRAGAPKPLGRGDLPCAEFARAVAGSARAEWLVFEWDKAWLPEIADADRVLPDASRALIEWTAAPAPHAARMAAAL